MTGARIEFTLNAGSVVQALNRLIERTDDLTPLMTFIGEALLQTTQARFDTGTGPDGAPWKPSRRATNEGGQTLVDSTRLLKSINYQAGAQAVSIGTNVLYAAIHQFGGTIRPKTAKALTFVASGRRITVGAVNMPARPFLGLSEADGKEIEHLTVDYLDGALRLNQVG
jgi:phage virion morphogenesis protein